MRYYWYMFYDMICYMFYDICFMIYVLWYMFYDIWSDMISLLILHLLISSSRKPVPIWAPFWIFAARILKKNERYRVDDLPICNIRGCVSHRPWNSGDLPSVSMVPCSMVHADLPESSAPTESARSSRRRHCRKVERSRSSGRRDRHAMKPWTKES